MDNYIVWAWLAVAVILLVIEAITINLVTIWFAIGALCAMVMSIFVDSFFINFAAFVVVSFGLLIITKPMCKKIVKKVPTNVDRLIGQTALVTQEIDPVLGAGQVTVKGVIWSAKTEGDAKVAKDKIVEITEISGVKLVVK